MSSSNKLDLDLNQHAENLEMSSTVNKDEITLNKSNHCYLSESTEMLNSSDTADKWRDTCIESSIEPHSTSNPEDDLTTYHDAFSSGESELEDLLYHFNNFFTSRLEQEVTHFQSNLADILFEQQNHVRRIVTAVTNDCNSQRSVDVHQTDSVIPEQTLGQIEHEPMITNQSAAKLTYSVSEDRDVLKKQRLLDLLAMSCSISTVLAKPEFR